METKETTPRNKRWNIPLDLGLVAELHLSEMIWLILAIHKPPPEGLQALINDLYNNGVIDDPDTIRTFSKLLWGGTPRKNKSRNQFYKKRQPSM